MGGGGQDVVLRCEVVAVRGWKGGSRVEELCDTTIDQVSSGLHGSPYNRHSAGWATMQP